jgi:hypothetical protein
LMYINQINLFPMNTSWINLQNAKFISFLSQKHWKSSLQKGTEADIMKEVLLLSFKIMTYKRPEVFMVGKIHYQTILCHKPKDHSINMSSLWSVTHPS